MELIPHTFNKYQLTLDEQRSGQSLTLATKAVIQNLIVAAAEEKLALVLDPKNITEYSQQEAYLRGQIDILNHLLDLSNFATTTPEV